ncbi:MAG TPA: PilN domain-containing protein [Candidatus Angelobacter sp.]|nr:PilN domain-containing protein [Candidatus Angelobacter sp.]
MPTISVPGEGSSTIVLALIVFGAVGIGIVVSWLYLDRTSTQLKKDMQVAEAENRRLAEVKTKYEASKKKADMFERRVKVIDDLKEAQKGPVTLLDLVAETVNKTDAVWLNSVTSDGKNLDFIGMALSPDAVADLMANLRKTGAFKSVDIKETAQDASVKEVVAFKFELICEIGFSSKVQQKA